MNNTMRNDITKHSKKTQYTSKNQPSPEAKSAGQKLFYQRKKIKEDLQAFEVVEGAALISKSSVQFR